MDSCPHVIDSVLRCLNFEEAFIAFFRLNSPKFKNFREIRQNDNKEFDISFSSVHSEFIQLIEDTLTLHLQKVIHDPLLDVVQVESMMVNYMNNIENDSIQKQICSSVVEQLDRYCDFMQFGEMMEDKCYSLYPSSSFSSLPEKPLLSSPSSSPSSSSSKIHNHRIRTQSSQNTHNNRNIDSTPIPTPTPTLTPTTRYVRVLWDIENIAVKKGYNALKIIQKLQLFLATKGCWGEKIDGRITAFFRPPNQSHSNQGVSTTVIEDLDRAAVELVWIASKREDADRKLVNRINQEMQVLPPAETTFVVISSDQDFRTQLQLLRNSGYRVIVLHNAVSEKWIDTLELHSEAYRWNEIVYIGSGNGNVSKDTLDGDDTVNNGSEMDMISYNQKNKNKNNSNHKNKVKKPKLDLAIDVWYIVRCNFFNGQWGFFKVTESLKIDDYSTSEQLSNALMNFDESHSQITAAAAEAEKTVKVFAHKSILPDKIEARNLSKGDWLLVQVDLSDARGPTAIKMMTIEDFTLAITAKNNTVTPAAASNTTNVIEEKKKTVIELPPI